MAIRILQDGPNELAFGLVKCRLEFPEDFRDFVSIMAEKRLAKGHSKVSEIDWENKGPIMYPCTVVYFIQHDEDFDISILDLTFVY